MSKHELTTDELTLPIKRTEGETLKDRLTANAYENILPARYLKKDAEGEVAETQEELFERVAKNIALAEAVYEADRRDIELTVTPDQLKPDHPRRDELASDVFGAGITADDDAETVLTERNVNKFAYETIVPALPDEVRDHVESVAAEFQELMESLSFMPNCVPPDSLVAAEGGLKPLTDIESGERVYDDEDGNARVESKFENGEKLVMEIETTSGYSVRATPEHYFRVITGSGDYEWRQVDDIEPDDVIALQKNFLDDEGSPADLRPLGVADGGTITARTGDDVLGRPRANFEAPDSMTPALAEWLGLYVGDGTARESGVRVAFDGQDADLLDYWCGLTESVFGFEPTSRTRSDAACEIGQAYRRDLYEFLDRNDLLKETSKTATIPEPVLESGRTCIASFLRGLFEADGTVGERSIELYTHSEPLADRVQKLLLGLGIRSSLNEKRDGYRVTIRRNMCGKRFVERVGFISERKRTATQRFETVSENATSVKIPNQTERLHEWFQESDLGLDAYRDLSQFLIDPDSKHHQEINVGIFKRYAEKYPELWDSPVAEFVRRDQFYEPVSNIKEIGTMAVEDMQVPRRNTYVVEGFVSHNSPTLMNAGDELQQLSACFVMSPEDDLNDIHEKAQEAAMTFQSGGGVGYAFWRLRPYGDPVGSTGGIASGPLTFMRTFDQMCETIAQGGTRRGAQMAIMRVSHPDVIEFIHSKNKDVSLAHTLRLNDPDDYTYTSFNEALAEARELIDEEGRVPKHLRNAVEGHLSNFNISVGVTDGFMEALQHGEGYTFINPRTGEPHVATEHTKEMYDRYGLGEYVTPGEELSLPASVLWERIVEGAHENGEPGVIYLDRVNDEHSFPVESTPTGDSSEYEILATNPCVAEGTLVNTPGGYRPVEEIEVGDEISTVIGSEPVDEIEVHHDYPVYHVEFSDGGSMDVTAQHRFHVLRDDKRVEKIPLREVEVGDHVRLHPGELDEEGTDEQYERELKRGLLLGDGCYTETALDRNHVHISTSVEDTGYNARVKELFGEENFRSDDPHSEGKATKMVLSDGGTVVQRLDLNPAKAPGKSFDPTELTTEAEVMGVLDGLLASDGNVNLYSNHPQIRWDTSSEDLAGAIRKALLSVGIHGRITVIEDPKRGGSINGRKVSADNPKYTVNVSGASARRYAEKSRLEEIHPEKGEQLFELRTEWMTTGNTWKAQVESIEKLDETTTVYDLYCEESDTWITEGYVQLGCGEQPLMEYEACNLGHINLSTIADVDTPDWRVWSEERAHEYDSLEAAISAFLDEAIDIEEFDHRIEWGTRFLENVVTMSDFPVEKIEETVYRNRKIGLGIMGLAQLYIQLGVRYGSEEANEVARQLMEHINHGSKWASHELADERGSFANWGDSKYADPAEHREWFEHQTGLDASEWADGFAIRNHNTTTIAPTGTTSMVGNTTGGCEPIYNVAYYKNVSDDVQGDEMLVEFDDYFLRVLEANDIDVETVKAEAQDQMATNAFDGVSSLETVPDAIGELFVVTADITAKEHAAVQCACQQGVDSAISKTVNAPNDSTVDDAKDVFEYIYDHGGKGVTYYRDGTRSKQVLTTRAQNAEFADETEAADVLMDQIEEVFGGLEGFLEHEDVRDGLEEEIQELIEKASYGKARKRPRPDVLHGVTQRIETGYGKLYVNINEDEEGRPFELFANIGNSGGFTASFTEALAKTISTALRSGVDPREIADELQGIRSPKVAWDKGEQIQSIPDAIGTAMRRYLDGDINRAYPQQQTLEETAEEEADADGTTPSLDAEPERGGRGDESGPETGTDTETEPDGGAVTADGRHHERDDHQAIVDAGENPECPQCGSMALYFSEGCKTCENCGWSEC